MAWRSFGSAAINDPGQVAFIFGLGSTLVNAVTSKDYPSVQAVALIFGAFNLVINFVVDTLLAVINPQSTILDQ